MCWGRNRKDTGCGAWPAKAPAVVQQVCPAKEKARQGGPSDDAGRDELLLRGVFDLGGAFLDGAGSLRCRVLGRIDGGVGGALGRFSRGIGLSLIHI